MNERMTDERIYLKVKVKSLAAEAKIIRKEEKRCKTYSLRNGLYRHRIDVVRYEARHTNLAYGFLRGIDYRKMEPNAKEAPKWDKIRKMVEKYGSYHPDYECGKYDEYQMKLEEAKKHLAEVLKRFDEWVVQAKVPPINHSTGESHEVS